MASSTMPISLFLALNCVLLTVSAIGVQDGNEVPVLSVPNANIPMTVNEANTLSGEKEILPATVPGNPAVPVASVPNSNIPVAANEANTLLGEKETLPATVPVNPAVPFNVDVPSKPDMPNTPIVNNPVELIDKPEHSEQSMQNDDISNVDIKGEDNLKSADKIPTPVNAGNMNLVNVLNVLDDLKKKLDNFKEDIIQLALPIGMAAQMTVLKPEVEMSEVKPAEESNVAVEAAPQQPNVSENVNEPVKPVQVEGFADIPPREARSPYYRGGYGRPGYGGGYGRPGYGGGYGRPGYWGGYGGGYGRPGYGGGYGRPGYGGGYGRPGYGGGYGYGSN